MKAIAFALSLLIVKSVFAIRPPVGYHLVKSCVGVSNKTLKVYVYGDTRNDQFNEIVLEFPGGTKKYEAVVLKQNADVENAPLVFSAKVPGGRLTLSISGNVNGNKPNALLSSAVYGARPTKTTLQCATVMY